VGPRAGLDDCEEHKTTCPCRNLNPVPSSSKARRYTDYSMPAAVGGNVKFIL